MPCLLTAAVLAVVVTAGLGICAACWPSLVLQCLALPQDAAAIYDCFFVLGTVIGAVWQFCGLPLRGSSLCWLVVLVAALLPEQNHATAPVQPGVVLDEP
jgi:hypothetical protein